MEQSKIGQFSSSPVSRDQVCSRRSPRAVFCVGHNQEALRQHEEAIRSRSDLAVRALNPEEAETWSRMAEPRVWIFCKGLELSRLVYLACSVRRYSRNSRLLLECEKAPGFEASLFDEVLRPAGATDALLEAVSHLAVA